jgi:hypothetical protein
VRDGVRLLPIAPLEMHSILQRLYCLRFDPGQREIRRVDCSSMTPRGNSILADQLRNSEAKYRGNGRKHGQRWIAESMLHPVPGHRLDSGLLRRSFDGELLLETQALQPLGQKVIQLSEAGRLSVMEG